MTEERASSRWRCAHPSSVLTTSSTIEQSSKQQVQAITVFGAGVRGGVRGAEEGEAERQHGKKEIRHRHRRGGARRHPLLLLNRMLVPYPDIPGISGLAKHVIQIILGSYPEHITYLGWYPVDVTLHADESVDDNIIFQLQNLRYPNMSGSC